MVLFDLYFESLFCTVLLVLLTIKDCILKLYCGFNNVLLLFYDFVVLIKLNHHHVVVLSLEPGPYLDSEQTCVPLSSHPRVGRASSVVRLFGLMTSLTV